MTIVFEERLSDSPYIENVCRGWTVNADSTIRPAENHWHMVLRKLHGETNILLVGALPTSGIISYGEGAELLWIKFKLGTWLAHLPVKEFVDNERLLPNASSQSFWLQGSSWQFPDYENVETFVERLVHQEVLVRDPVVNAALEDELPDMSPRTVRHRFMRTTGLTQTYIRQMQRAQQAAELLRQGTSILDTVFETGYFDQPHLTKSLKQFIGYTPAQLVSMTQAE